MIGSNLSLMARSLGIGGRVQDTITFLGSSPGTSVTSTTATMVLPVTAQAGDIVVMATSAASSSYSSSSPAASFELASGAPRVRVVKMLGGETTVSMVHTVSTGLRHRCLMFRPSNLAGPSSSGVWSNAATNPPISQAVVATPSIGIIAGTHVTTSLNPWVATVPAGFTVVENTPYSASNLRALYLGYKIMQPGEVTTGNFTLNVSTVSPVAYVGVVRTA